MGTVATKASDTYALTLFSDDRETGDREHVAAVVVQRHHPRPREPIARSVRRWLSTFGRRESPPVMPEWTIPAGWDSSSGGGGPREVLLSRTRRLVRVGEREFPLAPRGQTLVLLVDARVGARPAEHPITRRVLLLAPVVAPLPRPDLPRAAWLRQSRDHFERLTRRAEEALEQDATSRDFVRAARQRTPTTPS